MTCVKSDFAFSTGKVLIHSNGVCFKSLRCTLFCKGLWEKHCSQLWEQLFLRNLSVPKVGKAYFRYFHAFPKLGTTVFRNFARSQSWENLFSLFSCIPKVGSSYREMIVSCKFWFSGRANCCWSKAWKSLSFIYFNISTKLLLAQLPKML